MINVGLHLSRGELLRRYTVFFVAIMIGAFGVTLVTRATIGVNSVACVSYVSSVYFPLTMGTVTILFYSITVLLQFLMLSRAECRAQFINIMMQFPTLVLFGVMVDVFMYLTRDFHPDEIGYWACFATFAAGSVIIALNIALQFVGDVAKIPGDAFVMVLARKINKKLGMVKLCYDLILVVAAAAISLYGSGFTEIIGIREGTILGSLAIGPIVQLFLPHLAFLERWILKARTPEIIPDVPGECPGPISCRPGSRYCRLCGIRRSSGS